jgi:hypothetical protein
MSVVRPKLSEDPIQYDPAAVFAAGTVAPAAVAGLAGRLAAARTESLADLDRWRSGGAKPGESLDPAFIDLPDRLLAAYKADRTTSELFAILQAARRIREAVDRVIVLGILPVKDPAKWAKCRETNRILASYQYPKDEVVFLDLAERFLNADGTLKAELFSDGTHLTADGYQVMADALVPQIERCINLGPIKSVE